MIRLCTEEEYTEESLIQTSCKPHTQLKGLTMTTTSDLPQTSGVFHLSLTKYHMNIFCAQVLTVKKKLLVSL